MKKFQKKNFKGWGMSDKEKRKLDKIYKKKKNPACQMSCYVAYSCVSVLNLFGYGRVV